MSLGQSQHLFQAFEQCQILISVSLHFLRIDSLMYLLPAASTCARKRRPYEQFFATSPLVAELVDLSDEFSNGGHFGSIVLFRDSQNMTTAGCMSDLSQLAIFIAAKLNNNPIAISRPRRVPGVRSCRRWPVMLRPCLLLDVVSCRTSVNMWLVKQVAVGVLSGDVAAQSLLATINMVDESESFLPLGFVREWFGENVCHLFISANIDHVEKSTLKLLLQPAERNTLGAIGVSHFLTVAFW